MQHSLKGQQLDITWYGLSCFRIAERGQITIITDPFSGSVGLPIPRLKADVVTISHNQPGHSNVDAVKGVGYTLTGPGEYEIGGTFISGFPMHHVSDSLVHENVAYVIRYDALTVLHLGDLAHVPDQSTVEALGEVSALLVPVGGGKSLRAAMAAEVIAMIEPHYIIPMHYALPDLALPLDPVEKFLKEMGISKVQEAESLRITQNNLPEQPEVVVLRPTV